MERSYKEIIDNETGDYSMSKFLDQTIPQHTKVDIATGFFNIGGYGSVQDVLEGLTDRPNGRFRLLFGKESISDMDPDRDDHQHTLHADLESSVDEERKNRADALIRFLNKSNVSARKSVERFSHAKCYVFDGKKAVVGSSNFTRMGLEGNIELNAVLYQPAVAELVSDWFERRWEKADDAKEDLIHLVEESKFGLPLDPHTMYMKMLYEYYRQRIEDMETMRGKGAELTEFQQDAVTEAKRILRKYGGVMISDSTGLGKTHIGVELLRFLLMEERRKVLLIAPAQVKNTVWKPRLLQDSVKTEDLSMESVGQPDFDPSRYLNFDIVLIDESHNLRSHAAQRRINIMKILAGGKRKTVILMSATPINNSIMDLYYQLSLITAGDDLYFANLDIPDLRNHFVQAAKKKVQEGINTIVRILDEVMIKRTRTHIKENYPDATLNGKPVKFPKRDLHKVEYSLTNLYGANVYRNVIDTIDKMHLVPYRLVMYDKKADDDEKRRAGQIAVLQKIILTKRFESSIEAIRSSIRRLEKFYDMFEKAIDEGKILNSKKLGKILEEIRNDEENDEEKIVEILGSDKLALDPLGSNYDKNMIKAELTVDRRRILELLKDLDKIKPYGDTKLRKLEEDIIKYEVLEKGSKKMVIFTSYVDTARYVYKHLESVLDDKRVLLLTGNVSPRKRQEILEQFSPRSNYADGNIPTDLEEADVLVTTEVLSEGQNLQDCNYVVNYDLPWNPMRIVQRVGRVDRLTSRYKKITSAVLVPEKELNDLLLIMEKLEAKIQVIADVVGTEGSILGEKENPKEFNAIDRIRREDAALIDDMERSTELLTVTTPYQDILKYIKGIGREKLRNIKMGKRSGLRSEHSGAVMMYREESNDVHMVLYGHEKSQIVSVNDVTGSFARIKCKEGEEISIPFPGNKSFEYIKEVDGHARREILQKVNSGIVKKAGRNVGGKYQIAVRERIMAGFTDEQTLTREDVGDTYDILDSMSLVAWEFDLREFVDQHNIGHDTKQLLRNVQSLFGKYQIEKKPRDNLRKISEGDLQLVGCMFLDGPEMNDVKLTA